MHYYYYLNGKEVIACEDVIEWAQKFEFENRTIEKTEINEILISTVFLGVNYNFGNGDPLLFETMVFGGKLDGEQDRYSTWDEAEKGHQEMVKRVEESINE